MQKNTSSQAEENKFWLALLHTPGLGNRTCLKILEQYMPRQLFSLSRQQLLALGLQERVINGLLKPDWNAVDKDLRWLQQNGNEMMCLNDRDYPALLKQIPDPPPILFYRGNAELLDTPQIAIVGSRNPSRLGLQTAEDFASNLAGKGFTITSGLALGIDAASHRGALKAAGKTIAVAGTGLDRVYPARNKALAMEIVSQGLLISEFPPGTAAKANHFPRRNRIISGLSIGLLVVEAARQSGSLITARLALEQGREVFAIPGSIHNPLARGCNTLIREGAKLVETTQDILEELDQYNQQPDEKQKPLTQSTLDLEQQKLLNLILYSPTSVDTLVNESGQSVEVISSMLLMLELEGHIIATPGGGYMRIK